jgi:hypothetical protein
VARFLALVPFVFVVFGGQAPRRVIVVRPGAALRAAFDSHFGRTLQGARFFEAPMPSLFHVELPLLRRAWTFGKSIAGWRLGRSDSLISVADDLDIDAMLQRFQARARAVRQRGIPPLEGPERKRFVDQARIDYMDYAMIGDAQAHLQDGILTLSIDLRPKPAAG